jgi:hypothetical protein
MSIPTTRLGRTGLEVSRLALGTMTFGLQTEEPVAREIMNKALERASISSMSPTSIRWAADWPRSAGPRKSSAVG